MKKIGILFMVMTLVLSSVSVNAASDDTEIRTEEYVINITDISHNALYEGRQYDLSITVENEDYVTWRNVFFSLDFGDAPIHVIDANNGEFVDYFYADESYNLNFTIEVDDDVSGNYEAVLSVIGEFSDDLELDVEKELVFTINEFESDVNFSATVEGDVKLEEDGFTDINVLLTNDDFVRMADIQVNSLSEDIRIVGGDYMNNVEFIDSVATIPITISHNGELVSEFKEIEIEISYSETELPNVTFEKTISLLLEVESDESDEDYQVDITPITVSDKSLYVGDKSTLTTTVKNMSTDTIEEVIVTLDYEEEVVPISQDTIIIHDMEPGAEQSVSFTVEATDDADTRNHTLGIFVEYEEMTTKQYAGVYVYNDDDDEEDDEVVSQPKLMVTSYDIGKEKLYAGETFQLDFNVINTNKEQTVENIKITVEEVSTTSGTSSTSKVFMPYGTGSSVYVDQLASKEEANVKLSYSVLEEAEGQIYTLEVTYDYEDEDGNTYEDSETISIPVYQMPELTISDISYGSVLDNGFTLEADFYNTGKIDIDNLMVDIEIDGFQTANSNYYVGTFESGRTDVYDVEVMGSKPDSISGQLIFTYDDSFGQTVEIVEVFSIGEGSSDTAGKSSGGGTTDTTDSASSGAGMRNQAMGTMELPDGMTQEEMREMVQSGEISMEDIQNGNFGQEESSALSGLPLMEIGIGALVVIALVAGLIIRKRRRKEA